MRLLIATQAVDESDPILGFFCRWLTEFSKHFETIEVICLREGKHHLPENVHVHSLGKEKGSHSRLVYATRFKLLSWRLRTTYDAVFVHMNPEYVILGGPFWKLAGKKISFWYNHPKAGIRFSLAAWLADIIFYTSPDAASAPYKKAKQMPVGIDTELFKSQPVSRVPRSLYMQGRIMPSKRVEIFLEAIRILRTKMPITATFVGPEEKAYGARLRREFADLIASGTVSFVGPKKNEETPVLFSSHSVSINLAAAGHFDKSVFESMACETPVVVSSKAFTGLVPDAWVVPENDPVALADTLAKVLALPDAEYRALGAHLRSNVVQKHSLVALAQALSASYHTPA